MAVSWTAEVGAAGQVPEAQALVALMERYQKRVVEQLAVTEELLGQAGHFDGCAEGVAETVDLLEAVAQHLRQKDVEVGRLMSSLERANRSGQPPGGGAAEGPELRAL